MSSSSSPANVAAAADLRSLSDAEIAAMPVDRLGLLVLADVDRTNPWNWRNWMLDIAAERGSAQLDAAQDALAEAWGWLQASTLVSTMGSSGSYGFHDVQVTRAGREALAVGLRIYAGRSSALRWD